jgi:putative transposase
MDGDCGGQYVQLGISKILPSLKRKKRIAELKAQAGPDLILLFGDSAEVSTFPTITRCWTPIGQQRTILTPGMRAAKRWDWGAVDPVTGRTVNVIHHRRNNVGFRRLLAAISRAYDLPSHPERKVVLFVDNDKAHKAKRVHELLERHGHQIQIKWLPPYSPELNPQEDVWQDMRRCVTHNHYFEHVDELLQAVQEFHQQLESSPERVLRLLRKWVRLIST